MNDTPAAAPRSRHRAVETDRCEGIRRADRLLGILLHLQAHGGATAAALATRFEVSRRTILRDIDALCAAGVPVVSASGPGGGYRLMRGYFLPPLAFRHDEAWALLCALRALLAHGGTPHGAALAEAARKVAAVLDPATRIKAERMARRIGLYVWAADPGPALDVLAEAVAEGRGLVLTYDGPRGVAEREVDPHLLYAEGGYWYLRGYCHDRRADRTFRTDRIRHARPSGRTFVPPEDEDVAEPHPHRRTAPHTKPNVRLHCAPEALRRFDRYPEWTIDRETGCALARVPADQFPFVARLILGSGPGVIVEEPRELRALVAALAARVASENAALER